MTRLDRVRFSLPTGELVTVTVAVDRPGYRRSDRDRRQAAELAALLWMALQEEDAAAPSP